MRRAFTTCTALAVVLALGLTASAVAKFLQTATVSLTAHRAGQTTGMVVRLSAADPTALGAKPKALRSLRISFPAHTKFNLGTSSARACRLTDKQLTTAFGPRCPRASQIGTGTAVANLNPLQAVVNAPVRAYIRGDRQLILFVTPKLPGATPIIIPATVSGSTLSVRVPRLVYGQSSKPKFAGVTGVLVALKLTVPAMGAGPTALISAGRCTAHEFAVTSRFTYADHSRLTLHSKSRCR